MEKLSEFNQFDLIPDGKGEYEATHNGSGKRFISVSTDGDYGCEGCYFCNRHKEADKTGACHSLPCGADDWEDKCSRIWKKIV